MARYRQLPMGLPPHLVGRIAHTGAGSLTGYDPGLNALGFSFKKAFKSVAKVATKVGQIAIAPMKLGIEAPLKAVTWAGAGIIIASGLYLLRRERVHVEAEHP